MSQLLIFLDDQPPHAPQTDTISLLFPSDQSKDNLSGSNSCLREKIPDGFTSKLFICQGGKLLSTFCSSKTNIKKCSFLGKVWVTFICVKVKSAHFTSTYLSMFPNVFLQFPDTGPKSHSNWSLNLDLVFQHLCFDFNTFPLYFPFFKSLSLKTLFILKRYLNPIFPSGHEAFL